MALPLTHSPRAATARPGRRTLPSMTDQELQAYFAAREALRRLRPPPAFPRVVPRRAADAAAPG